MATYCQPAGATFIILLHSSCLASSTADPGRQPQPACCRGVQGMADQPTRHLTAPAAQEQLMEHELHEWQPPGLAGPLTALLREALLSGFSRGLKALRNEVSGSSGCC